MGLEAGQHDQRANDVSTKLQSSIKSPSNSPSHTVHDSPPVCFLCFGYVEPSSAPYIVFVYGKQMKTMTESGQIFPHFTSGIPQQMGFERKNNQISCFSNTFSIHNLEILTTLFFLTQAKPIPTIHDGQSYKRKSENKSKTSLLSLKQTQSELSKGIVFWVCSVPDLSSSQFFFVKVSESLRADSSFYAGGNLHRGLSLHAGRLTLAPQLPFLWTTFGKVGRLCRLQIRLTPELEDFALCKLRREIVSSRSVLFQNSEEIAKDQNLRTLFDFEQ